MNGELKIFSGNANVPLARAICKHAGVELGQCEIIKFSNENIKIKILESVRGRDVFVIQPSCPPVNEGIMELLILIDAIKHASAERITAVTPYFPYVRSDKKDEPRISITARLMGQLFHEAGADRVLTVNLHALQIQGFVPVPCDQLDANPLIAEYFRRNYDMSNFGVLATDAGGVKWATAYAEMLKAPLAVCDKRRWSDNEDPEIRNVIGVEEIRGKHIAIFDDEILTGGTMARAITALKEKFHLNVSFVSCIHGVFAKGAAERILKTGVEHIVTTDSVPPPTMNEHVHVVSTAPLLAAAIRNIHTGQSVTQIFRQPNFLFQQTTLDGF